MPPVALGLDIGTTGVKVAAFTPEGALVALRDQRVGLSVVPPGRAEQVPGEILDAVRSCLAGALDESRAAGHRVVGVAVASAMHSLVGLDGRGQPATRIITWADERAVAQAERLEGIFGAGDYRRVAGVRMSAELPAAKLAWFREREAHQGLRWTSVKGYVLRALTGTAVTDPAVAAASGLLDVGRGDWNEPLLVELGLELDQLDEVVPATHRLEWDVPLFVGSSDGVLSNSGAGATRPGAIVFSVGTSGAVRASVPAYLGSGLDLFCYPAPGEGWVLGSAVNNGGAVVDWLVGVLGLPDRRSLDDLAAAAPAGSDGVLVLPFLRRERSHGPARAPGVSLSGLGAAHGLMHMARATLEAVIFNMRRALSALEAAGIEVDEVRATGGFTRSRPWCQILADALGKEVLVPRMPHAPAIGAAALAFRAAGLEVDAAALAGDADVVQPIPENVPVLAEAYRRYLDRSRSTP